MAAHEEADGHDEDGIVDVAPLMHHSVGVSQKPTDMDCSIL